jgi:hypothetical protein
MAYLGGVRFPLTPEVLDQAKRFGLRSSCVHCFYYFEAEQRCSSEWPLEGQERWPLEAPDPDGSPATHIHFCREFELR